MEDKLVLYCLIGLGIGFFLAFTASLYACARLRKFERSVTDLEWDDLADLVIDVGKLKKNAQKYQQNVNAAQKMTQKEKLALALEEAQSVVPMRYSNMNNMER